MLNQPSRLTFSCSTCSASLQRWPADVRKSRGKLFYCSRICSDAANRAPVQTGVYAILHIPTGQYYVGSSSNIARRWTYHRSALNGRRHENFPLQVAWNCDGPSAFNFIFLEETPTDTLLEREQGWLDLLGENGQLFNLHRQAGSGAGYQHSPETRAKVGAARLGSKLSEETKARISASNIGKQKGRAAFGLERRSLHEEDATAVKRAIAAGGSIVEISRNMRIPEWTVQRIALLKTYSSVAPELNEFMTARTDGRKSPKQHG